ncbi:hypothetical protein L873DRAFT_223290 [Choiromyces venosus 120613-1]|uniref:Uncharacterized protein n=1 Tax=Choiromyces venosus 120613-1 TaxID=1336337 RepID=A0A3N4KBE4_9PEZI|nr:hypothetical protein L873DRAFT_223290 [Choiromyces venosus 120613-1]
MMITQPLRSLISRPSVSRTSAGVAALIGADAVVADAFPMLRRRQSVPSGTRGPVYRRSTTAMGLNDRKKSLLIAGSRYAIKKEAIAGSGATLSSLRSSMNSLLHHRSCNYRRTFYTSSVLLTSDRENTIIQSPQPPTMRHPFP